MAPDTPRRSGNARQSFLDQFGPEPGGHHHGPDRRCGQERGLDARVERGEVKRRTCNGPFFLDAAPGFEPGSLGYKPSVLTNAPLPPHCFDSAAGFLPATQPNLEMS